MTGYSAIHALVTQGDNVNNVVTDHSCVIFFSRADSQAGLVLGIATF